MTTAEMLEEWHSAVSGPRPQPVPRTVATLRAKLIREESKEAAKELYKPEVDRALLAKELADTVYVTYGTAREYDISLDAVIAEVHRSNLTKIKGGKIERDDGKIEKGPHYEEADVAKLLR